MLVRTVDAENYRRATFLHVHRGHEVVIAIFFFLLFIQLACNPILFYFVPFRRGNGVVICTNSRCLYYWLPGFLMAILDVQD